MTPTAGDRFGPYQILGRLGRGGMGLVFRAVDERLHREVAIKLLILEPAEAGTEYATNRERFLREARAASALNHPHICTIFDIGERDGTPYLVMELLEGETLKARLERGALPADEIVRYGREIADALSAAQARGIVHRDIKPANIFLVERLGGESQTKVLDFGLAQVGSEQSVEAEGVGSHTSDTHGSPVRRGHIPGMTEDGETVGTVAYMSPEQARGEPLDARADLFSLGVVMYEMATRRVPFQASTDAHAFERLMADEPDLIRDWNDTVPRGLEKIILRLLQKDPEKRFQSAAEVSAALEKLIGKSGRGPGHTMPAVPLVRAEEPVARRELPMRENATFDELTPSNAEADERPVPPLRRARLLRIAALWAASAVVTVGGLWAGLMGPQGLLRAPALKPDDLLMIATVENRTADQYLDGTLEQGLELVLAESPQLALRGGDAYRVLARTAGKKGGESNAEAMAPQAAKAAGARAYLYGTFSETSDESGKRFILVVSVRDTATGRELASAGAKGFGHEQIPAMIDRVAIRLRQQMGLRESVRGVAASDVELRADIPLSREATGNIEALHWYGVGRTAESDGRLDAAARAYESALNLDPRFVQAAVQLAWTDRLRHEEAASAKAAEIAETASGKGSMRSAILAHFAYQLNTAGDEDGAATTVRRLNELYPHDQAAELGLAEVLRLSGHFTEALTVAQKGIAEDPFDGAMCGEAELSLIALDWYDAALALELLSAERAASHPGIALMAAFLSDETKVGGDQRLAAAIEGVAQTPRSLDATEAYGLYLDNSGQLAVGTKLWRTAASEGDGAGAAAESDRWLLAHGALDHALAGDCAAALEMARAASDKADVKKQDTSEADVELGLKGSFPIGLATGLCGDKESAEQVIQALAHGDVDSTDVVGYHLPDLRAAVALGAHDPQGALNALRGARPYDPTELAPYLRGLAHLGLKEGELAAVDFQGVLDHPGIALTGGSNVYPMAEIGLARAFAANGDKDSSARAYQRFLELWRTPAPADRLRAEALAGSR